MELSSWATAVNKHTNQPLFTDLAISPNLNFCLAVSIVLRAPFWPCFWLLIALHCVASILHLLSPHPLSATSSPSRCSRVVVPHKWLLRCQSNGRFPSNNTTAWLISSPNLGSPLMATIDLAMAGRRVPFADVPNAINSPIRAGAGKRTRIQLDEAHDLDQIQPPAKKQLLDLNQENIEPRPGYTLTKVDDQFPKRSPASQPTSLERKLAASRAKPPSRSTADETASIQQTRLAVDNLESVRQWQRHYRRQFPAFIFYLDAIPDDARSKFSRHIKALGAVWHMSGSCRLTITNSFTAGGEVLLQSSNSCCYNSTHTSTCSCTAILAWCCAQC